MTAVVIENREVSSSCHSGECPLISYTPVFRYSYKEKEYISKTVYSTNPPVFEVGQQTDIFIDPSEPEAIYVPDLKAAGILHIIFTVLGAVIMAGTVIVYMIIN